jgi:hypothetical protein
MYLARPMRFLVLSGLILLPLANSGCKSSSTVADGPKTNRVIHATLVTNKPALRPADVIAGRIIAVREPLRFVIIDFPGSRMPRLDQQLSVYRLDQKVAELKVSGPFLGTTVAADVTAGQPYEGDLVRDR